MNDFFELSQRTRLMLYIAMAILPVWIDFFKISTDYSLRGLAMPILASINAAVIVALARTAPRGPKEPQKPTSGAPDAKEPPSKLPPSDIIQPHE